MFEFKNKNLPLGKYDNVRAFFIFYNTRIFVGVSGQDIFKRDMKFSVFGSQFSQLDAQMPKFIAPGFIL